MTPPRLPGPLLALALSTACADGPSPPPTLEPVPAPAAAPAPAGDEPCALTVRLEDRGGALSDAVVTLRREGAPPTTLEARADPDGLAAFPRIEVGAYALSAVAPGHVPQGATPIVCAGHGAHLDRTLTLVPADVTLRGRVTRPDRLGLDGALVALSQPGDGPIVDGAPAVVTGPDGGFTLGVAAGQAFVLEATADGYTTTSLDVRVDAAPEPVTLVLHPAHVVSGVVVDGAGRPVEGARVFVGPTGRARGSAPALTGPDGRFALPAHAGELRVGAVAEGLVGCAPVREGSRLDDVRIAVEPGVRVTGVVVGREGPIADAEVHWRTPACGVTGAVRADDAGRFTLPGVLREGTSVWTAGAEPVRVRGRLRDEVDVTLEVP